MEISKYQSQQLMDEFGLISLLEIPFSYKRNHKLEVLANVEGDMVSYPKPIFTSEFQESSGTKYVCGISSEHIRAIVRECSCLGDYGLPIQAPNTTLPLAFGHIINLNFNKHYLKKICNSKEEFLKENPSPVAQNLFANHKIMQGNMLFSADIVYRAIFEIVYLDLFNHFIDYDNASRHIKNSKTINIVNNMFAQDTYVKLIF
jgi:hypothetical protein